MLTRFRKAGSARRVRGQKSFESSFDELTVRAGSHSIPLTFMELDTLAYLMRSAPRAVSQQELFSSVVRGRGFQLVE
jgi:DNA-binding winged helix-turn-helix (wHTH) protein